MPCSTDKNFDGVIMINYTDHIVSIFPIDDFKPKLACNQAHDIGTCSRLRGRGEEGACFIATIVHPPLTAASPQPTATFFPRPPPPPSPQGGRCGEVQLYKKNVSLIQKKNSRNFPNFNLETLGLSVWNAKHLLYQVIIKTLRLWLCFENF